MTPYVLVLWVVRERRRAVSRRLSGRTVALTWRVEDERIVRLLVKSPHMKDTQGLNSGYYEILFVLVSHSWTISYSFCWLYGSLFIWYSALLCWSVYSLASWCQAVKMWSFASWYLCWWIVQRWTLMSPVRAADCRQMTWVSLIVLSQTPALIVCL